MKNIHHDLLQSGYLQLVFDDFIKLLIKLFKKRNLLTLMIRKVDLYVWA